MRATPLRLPNDTMSATATHTPLDIGRSKFVEARLKRQRQQETGEQLNTGLDHPQFLQQTEPIAVQPLGFTLRARRAVPGLIPFRMVDDVHGR